MHYVYLIIITIALIEACSQFCLKKGTMDKDERLYLFGFIGYAFIGYLLTRTYHYKGIGYSNLVWSALSIILACISGKIFFGEKINYMACILCLMAIYLINK